MAKVVAKAIVVAINVVNISASLNTREAPSKNTVNNKARAACLNMGACPLEAIGLHPL